MAKIRTMGMGLLGAVLLLGVAVRLLAEEEDRAQPEGIAYIRTVPEEVATLAVKAGYDAVRAKLGVVPNILKLYSSSPVAFAGLRVFGAAMADAKAWILPARERQLIGIVVADANDCFY